jgi:hypothetical protein
MMCLSHEGEKMEEQYFQAEVSDWVIESESNKVVLNTISEETITRYSDGKYEISLLNCKIADDVFKYFDGETPYKLFRTYNKYDTTGELLPEGKEEFIEAKIISTKTLSSVGIVSTFNLYISNKL